jgi:hypothetical protein
VNELDAPGCCYIATAAAIAIVGCGSKSLPEQPGIDSGVQTPGHDSGAAIDGALYADYVGYVVANSAPGSAAYAAAYARFVGSGDPDGCVDTPAGNGCRHTVCSSTSTPPPLLSAGDITIAGLASGPVVLVPGTGNDYGLEVPGASWWSGGEKVHVSAPGALGQAPTFAIELVAPAPSLDPTPPSVDGSGTISTSWVPPAVSDMLVLTELHAELRPDVGAVWCLTQAAAHTATMPSSVASVVLGATTKGDGPTLRVSGVTWSVASTPPGNVIVKLSGANYDFAL